MSSRFQSLYEREFQNTNKPLALIYGNVGHISPPQPSAGQYLSIGIALAHSYSSGHVHIKSASMHGGAPDLDFDAGTLSDVHGADVEVLVWAYKRSRDMVRRMWLSEGDLEAAHRNFSEASEAGIQRDEVLLKEFRARNKKGDIALKDIVYSEDNDKAIEEFVKARAGTLWHYAGTCAMKPRQRGGVVDSCLNVHGVEGLKIAGESELLEDDCTVILGPSC